MLYYKIYLIKNAMRQKSGKEKKLLILGANNPESLRIFEAVKAQDKNWNLIGYLDNDKKKHGSKFGDYTVLGGSEIIAEKAYRDAFVINAITRDCITRKKTTDQLLSYGARLTNLVHPSVDTKYVELGVGNIIHENVVLQPWSAIGDNCAINSGSIVSHECKIGDHSFLAPGCVICGIVEVGKGVMIGAGSVILPRLKIGDWSVIGAGSVVTKDVPSHSVVVGNPAKALRKTEKFE